MKVVSIKDGQEHLYKTITWTKEGEKGRVSNGREFAKMHLFVL